MNTKLVLKAIFVLLFLIFTISINACSPVQPKPTLIYTRTDTLQLPDIWGYKDGKTWKIADGWSPTVSGHEMIYANKGPETGSVTNLYLRDHALGLTMLYTTAGSGMFGTELGYDVKMDKGMPIFSPDGKYVAYVMGSEKLGYHTLCVKFGTSPSESYWLQVPFFSSGNLLSQNIPSIDSISWNPNIYTIEKSQLVVGMHWSNYPDDKQTYIVTLTAGKRLADAFKTEFFQIPFNGTNPKFYPDGKKILFEMPNSDYPDGVSMFTYDIATGGADGPMAGKDAVFSPDGKQIAFVGYHEVDGEFITAIFLINLDNTGYRRLTIGPDEDPAWSSDSQEIAFVRYFDNSKRIIIINIATEIGMQISDNNLTGFDEEKPLFVP